MTASHRDFLELAAAAIDFELAEPERAALARHVAECPSCRRRIEALHRDATAISSLPRFGLTSARADRLWRGLGRRGAPMSTVRLVALAAALALLALAALTVGAQLLDRRDPQLAVVSPSPRPSPTLLPSGSPGTSPGSDVGGTPAPSAGTPTARPSGSVAALPVRGSAFELGSGIHLSPAPDGGLYAVVDAPAGAVLTLLDRDGAPRSGWPVVIARAGSCGRPDVADDGSVRLICFYSEDDPECLDICGERRAYAYDADGRLMAGWPVRFDVGYESEIGATRLVGATLVVELLGAGDGASEAGSSAEAWLVTVASDGTMREGQRVRQGETPQFSRGGSTIGADGTAYAVSYRWGEGAPPATDVVAFDGDGIRDGWPVRIDGIASEPALDASGRLHLTLGWQEPPIVTIVLDVNGVRVGSPSAPLPGILVAERAYGDTPGSPAVAPDGTTFVIVNDEDRVSAWAIDPSGATVAGWPYRLTGGLVQAGYCPPGDTGCDMPIARPALGPGNVLYLLEPAVSGDVGGRVSAIGADGRELAGWPVDLRRAGSEFWAVVAAADGTIYALAIEPETGTSASATILAIAPDSSVIYTTTVVEP